MRLHGLHKLVEGWRRECSIDSMEVNSSDGGHARFIVPRAENKTRELGHFLPLAGDVGNRRPEHTMPSGKLKQRGPPSR